MQPEQSYANHRRFHPLFHFIVIPLLAINVVVQIVIAVRFFSAMSVWNVFVALAILGGAFLARFYGLRNQDRIIRLEEMLRLQRVLPDDLRARIGELRTRQLIGLRFCSDEELPEACRAVFAGEAPTHDAIKRRVKSWRPDYMRL
jgi:hypothetical protein